MYVTWYILLFFLSLNHVEKAAWWQSVGTSLGCLFSFQAKLQKCLRISQKNILNHIKKYTQNFWNAYSAFCKFIAPGIMEWIRIHHQKLLLFWICFPDIFTFFHPQEVLIATSAKTVCSALVMTLALSNGRPPGSMPLSYFIPFPFVPEKTLLVALKIPHHIFQTHAHLIRLFVLNDLSLVLSIECFPCLTLTFYPWDTTAVTLGPILG